MRYPLALLLLAAGAVAQDEAPAEEGGVMQAGDAITQAICERMRDDVTHRIEAFTRMKFRRPVPMRLEPRAVWEAKIEHARGNRAKAELWAKKALREDPSFLEAQEFLDQITG